MARFQFSKITECKLQLAGAAEHFKTVPVDDVLFEELKVLSILIQEGSESDGKLEELNRQLEELKNKKNKPTIIVKEVEVDKKKRR